ncbi:MAG: oxidoreductase [Rhizorhabdus sp.]|nr:oxidoreductase [Rhizorhabdus sp.]
MGAVIGFAIVGTGGMATAMAQAIRLSGEAHVVAVLSGDADRAAGFVAQHGGIAMVDIATMLAEPKVDAVYIAGRNRGHAAVTIAALAAGKAVLCEKPFACDVAEAEAVIAAASAWGRPFMEAVATPFLPAVAEAIRRAKSGAYGAIRHLSASFGYPVDRQAVPSLFADDAGVLRDRGVYPITIALRALGPVVEQRSEGSDAGTVRIWLQHDGGGRSDLAVSMVERLPNRMTIACDRGHIGVAAPLLKAQRLTHGNPSGRLAGLAQNPVLRRLNDAASRVAGRWHSYGASPYLSELRHFCTMVREEKSESAVLPHSLMLEVQRVLAKARAEL